jgi:hypothetical protein
MRMVARDIIPAASIENGEEKSKQNPMSPDQRSPKADL